MAVANFQYITRMSSGFKVYILEGQPHHRSEDRFRHIQTEPQRAPSGNPLKRKRSFERGLTLEERRERALSRSLAKAAERESQVASHSPQSSTSSWSPACSPTSPVPPHVYYAPIMDEPLALIKKPRKDPEITQEKPKCTTQIQMRPSVITCVSSLRSPTSRPDIHKPILSVSQSHCDRVVDEHFQRSLGERYQKMVQSQQQLSISVSVDDHFAKALGDKWQQIKCKSSSCSSTPPSSPSVTHSPTYNSSPYREPTSSNRWSIH
ncbi:vestigial like 4 like [Boleophthalmus pectinirostris]|uniref:vestigial like 4 like n=1 Tax=Boleophthalmus pectinirostris TaxID=150288 RepID=UPI000A1C573D|nr:vestigial like 4 like [Boleophthalmus pectinirostris]